MSEIPAACADLDLARVSRVLAKHYGDIPASARELRVPAPDLRRLTWTEPRLLEKAEDRCGEVVARVWGELIEALYSDDLRRQMWASDKIMSSHLARDHPLAPARRGRGAEAGRSCAIIFRWAGADGKDETTLDRDGRMVTVPRYGGEAARPPAAPARAEPSSAEPIPPPPEPPRREPEDYSQSRRRLSRGGYR
jgi:hypothetical protein